MKALMTIVFCAVAIATVAIQQWPGGEREIRESCDFSAVKLDLKDKFSGVENYQFISYSKHFWVDGFMKGRSGNSSNGRVSVLETGLLDYAMRQNPSNADKAIGAATIFTMVAPKGPGTFHGFAYTMPGIRPRTFTVMTDGASVRVYECKLHKHESQ